MYQIIKTQSIWNIIETKINRQLQFIQQESNANNMRQLKKRINQMIISMIKYRHLYQRNELTIRRIRQKMTNIVHIMRQIQLQTQYRTKLAYLHKVLFSQFQHFIQITNSKLGKSQYPITKTTQQNLQINQFLGAVGNNQIILTNQDCLKCIRILHQGQQIVNNNSINQSVSLVGLTEHQGFDGVTLQRALIALSNTYYGGIIFIGVQRVDNYVKPIGINFTNIYQIRQKHKQIMHSIEMLGLNSVQIQIVLVSPKLNLIRKLLQQKSIKYCFMIIVNPNSEIKEYKYLQIFSKGYQNRYEAYVIDDSYKPIKVQAVSKHPPNSIYYEMINKFYKKRRIKVCIHSGIFCYLPIQQQQPELLEYLQKLQVCPSNQSGNHQNLQDMKFGDDPKFTYAYTSLLSVSSLKNERYITDLIPYFKYRKFSVKITKPFQNSFKTRTKPIWMISHKQKFNIIKNAIKQQDKGGNVTFMPVFHTLQIQRSKFTEFNQNIFSEKFKKRYPNGYQLEWKTSIDVNNATFFTADLTFQNYTQSIYAYFLFQQMQLRPYFVQENTTFKKKSKKY